jgi:hypothetical protein
MNPANQARMNRILQIINIENLHEKEMKIGDYPSFFLGFEKVGTGARREVETTKLILNEDLLRTHFRFVILNHKMDILPFGKPFHRLTCFGILFFLKERS